MKAHISNVERKFKPVGPDKCCLCGCTLTEYGHNPQPLAPYENEDGSRNFCCSDCNQMKVVPARFEWVKAGKNFREV